MNPPGMIRAFLAAGLLVGLFLFAVIPARATVLLELAGGYLKDAAGGAIAPESGLLLLVASTGDAAFSAIVPTSSLATGSLLNADGDDLVLYRAALSGDGYMDGVATGGEFRLVISLDLDATTLEGSALQLYWFPTLTTASTSAAEGVAYGIYRSSVLSGAVDADGSSAWFLPADGTSGYELLFLTSDAGSTINTAASGTAANVVTAVPEPAGWALVGAGLAGIWLRRIFGRPG